MDATEFLNQTTGAKTMRLIREGEPPGVGLTPDELHNDVIVLAQQHAGLALSTSELSRLENYQRELRDNLVGRGVIADPVQAGDLAHMAQRAMVMLNQRAPAGKCFVLGDALYLIDTRATQGEQ